MRRIGIFTGLVIAALLPLAANAEDHTIVQPDSLKWTTAPPAMPKGAQIAMLYGDPAKEGAFAYRVKLPAGYKVPAHFHPNDENITVLSGSIHFGAGAKLDETKADVLKAGSYLHVPKGMQHYAWITEETVFQANGIGPAGITYVNPADDPRKTN